MDKQTRINSLTEIEDELINLLDTDDQNFISVCNEIIEHVREKMRNASTN